MTLQIEFKTGGADEGGFLVHGLPAVWSEVLVAIQRRADGRYLTMHGLWNEHASWYPCPRVDSSDVETRFAADQALTRGIRAAAGERLQVHLRRRDFSDTGPLAFPALPSSPPTHPIAPHQMGSAPAPVGNTQGAPPLIPPATRPAPTRPQRARPWALLALGVVCGLALLWWSLVDTETDGQTRPPGPSHPTGKALYLALQGQDLAPRDLFERAERAAAGGDCEAAIRIFVAAARRDPGLSVQLGRRYDPTEFRPTPCFAQPNADSAQVWYQPAAEAGITEAQRRYGELLLGEADAGPVYQDAIAWLRQAAAGGDAAAADRLMALGER